MSSYQADPSSAPSDDARAPSHLGRFDLVGHLATGGMAEIYLARPRGAQTFDDVAVVKRLLPELAASREYVAMFLDEMKLAGRLDHPNIVRLFECGRDGNDYFFAMEYLDGVNVHELIARPREADRMAELRIAAAIVIQACAGLHYAHELRDADGAHASLVHRDVSPSNIYVTVDGAVKVLDFGVAKVRGSSETEAGTIKGKTQYMAPEQLLGEPLDKRADVFALGIVLFELATHQRLFKRESDYLTARAILEEPIPRADVVDPAVPIEVGDVIAKALARSKADRYASATELATALDTALASHGGPATKAQIGAIVKTSDELTAQRTRRNRIIDAYRAPPTATTMLSVAPTSRSSLPLLALVLLLAGAGMYGTWRFVSAKSEAPIEPLPRPEVRPPTPLPTPVEDEPYSAVEADPPALVVVEEPRPVAKKPGTISIDSSPFATIYIDGKRVDVTPLLNHALSPGKHKVRAVLGDGRSKELTIDVPSGRAAKPLVIRW